MRSIQFEHESGISPVAGRLLATGAEYIGGSVTVRILFISYLNGAIGTFAAHAAFRPGAHMEYQDSVAFGGRNY